MAFDPDKSRAYMQQLERNKWLVHDHAILTWRMHKDRLAGNFVIENPIVEKPEPRSCEHCKRTMKPVIYGDKSRTHWIWPHHNVNVHDKTSRSREKKKKNKRCPVSLTPYLAV